MRLHVLHVHSTCIHSTCIHVLHVFQMPTCMYTLHSDTRRPAATVGTETEILLNAGASVYLCIYYLRQTGPSTYGWDHEASQIMFYQKAIRRTIQNKTNHLLTSHGTPTSHRSRTPTGWRACVTICNGHSENMRPGGLPAAMGAELAVNGFC